MSQYQGVTALIDEPNWLESRLFLTNVTMPSPAQPTARYCRNLNPLAQLIRGGKNDVGASRMFFAACCDLDDPIETVTILGRDSDDDACSHTQVAVFWNPSNASFHSHDC